MRQDFVTRLERQLLEAAAREARGGAVAGTVRVARRTAPWRLAAVGTALAAAVIAVLLAAAAVRNRETTPSHPAPRVIAHTTLAGQGGMLVAAYGAVWAVDAETGQLLRVDPRDGKVHARIATGGPVVVNRGAGSVWAAGVNEVLRIDPASSRVTARIRVPALRAGDILPAGGAMWLIEAGSVTRIDPARNAAGRPIGTSQGGFQNVGANTDGRTLYVMRGDGTLLAFDARTGKRLSSVHAAITGFPGAVADGSVILEGGTGVIAIDPGTGRARWSRDLGAQRVNNSLLAGGALWVQATDRATHRDRLWRLDAKTGRVTGSLVLPEFGAAGMAAVGSRIWVVSLSGELVVVQ